MSKPAVQITGALTGIGRAIALAFAKDGAHVVASGRREGEGQELETELRSFDAEAAFIRARLSPDEMPQTITGRATTAAADVEKTCSQVEIGRIGPKLAGIS
jgi:NAD(P)-dependent dehydrogenase (short-subunit alcohol dehydrogenase family)